ncbi:hypothetical protein L0Y41_00265 [bacterium]|nr:hypothetical protein [bacterium]
MWFEELFFMVIAAIVLAAMIHTRYSEDNFTLFFWSYLTISTTYWALVATGKRKATLTVGGEKRTFII